MKTRARIQVAVVGLALVAVGCGRADESANAAQLGKKVQAVEIARVANPPPQSDLKALPGDLRQVAVPTPTNLGDFVKDNQAAIALGKAFFWDMQIGSDGKTACGTCHFRAGADPRSKNQLSPGLTNVPSRDLTYKKGGPNYQLQAADFPLTVLAIPGVRGALDTANDNNDVVSSQGVHWMGSGLDPDGFSQGFVKTRRVEPRNTPTMINAVFNHRQFWDGRAEAVFNGVNHLGMRDPNSKVFRADMPNNVVAVRVELDNASLASQAIAPIVSDLEMSAPGRTPQQVALDLAKRPRELGRRTHTKRPLDNQFVDPTDSVLGGYSRAPLKGLNVNSYDKLIEAAFHEKWWKTAHLIQVDSNGNATVVTHADQDPTTDEYSLMEYNFALFFGIAIQMYETTLVADDTAWDRFRRENPSSTDPDLNPWTNTNPNHISRQALFGAHLFNDRSRGPTNIRCSNCHDSHEMTDASARRVNAATNGPVRNRDGNVIDKGFNNIGIRPTSDDLGVGASDAFGPISHTKRLFPGAAPATFDGAAVDKGFGIEGAFKIPGLRNVALTAPYFHNGEAMTLRQVVELYSRGGNVAPVTQLDGTIIEPLGVPSMTSEEIDAVVAFLESLTDERVLYRKAPFDHPQLFVPNGHNGDHNTVIDADGDGFADDDVIEIPAVGAAGGPILPGFMEGPFAPAATP